MSFARSIVRSSGLGAGARARLSPLVASQAQTTSRRFQSVYPTTGADFIAERRHQEEHAAKSAELWRRIFYYVCIPGTIVLGIYIYGIEAEHIHHRDHEIEENGGQLPERTQYDYNNIRKKPFPWGNNSIFFNPKANVDMSEA
ncbi:mitochondrial cytochrome c oxidase subunit VIa [Ceraceosorus guamensis]|uniref:Mitochondrial cytochrome c oxidase subunit VIa n=1 Tax=Ceraceosorus guamensis TaxID=1522189 RepID=A0A316W4Z9_9BASI|nr:mitochondrial cytochrome c oxidase subunit VIa [Ceraceosorus guamensis]PWN43751.1 mitochondrial cytochrome c oxidase subunit VIa [Ceraceosorus guamensis]